MITKATSTDTSVDNKAYNLYKTTPTTLLIARVWTHLIPPTQQLCHSLFGAKTRRKLLTEKSPLISTISITITGPSKHAAGITITLLYLSHQSLLIHTHTHTHAPAAKKDRGWEKNGAITRKQIKTEPCAPTYTNHSHNVIIRVCV